MYTFATDSTPTPDETLAQYLRRRRSKLGLSQKELARQAGIHVQSLGKIERGQTSHLNHHTCNGLATALAIPADMIAALSKGKSPIVSGIKICAHCWIPAQAPDSLWLDPRSKFCFACGRALQDRCQGCQSLIASVEHRFCPHCGKAYKSTAT